MVRYEVKGGYSNVQHSKRKVVNQHVIGGTCMNFKI